MGTPDSATPQHPRDDAETLRRVAAERDAMWLAFRQWMSSPPTGPLSDVDESFIAAMYEIVGYVGEPLIDSEEPR